MADAETHPEAAPARKEAGPLAWIGQVALYALFALVIGTFSHWPVYQHLEPDTAVIKLSLIHTGQTVAECRERTPEELAKMPPNMRVAMDCPRERSPVTVELDIDGELRAQAVAQPSGLSRDGASAIYRRLEVPAGSHELAVRLSDSVRPGAVPFELESRVELEPAQVLVVDFNSELREITLQ